MNWLDPLPLGIGAAVVLFVVGMALEGRRKRKIALTQLVKQGTTLPTLYPRINHDVCICSGACVSVCPEGDVIAMVDGKPKLVQASACVGHTDCLRACPVQAIELVLGSSERAVEVPVTSGTFETNVDGLYTAGEVNGIGRIHNAVAQGRQAAAAALDSLDPHTCDLDLVVVGAGPAGLAAGLEARRRAARYVVYEKQDFGGAILSYPRDKIVMTAPLVLPGVGPVKLKRTSKDELLDVFEHIVQESRLALRERAEITRIRPIQGGLRVETANGSVTAARVVLAIGRRGTPRELGVPGSHLPHVVFEVAEPALFAGAPVVVVGGGDSAIEVALSFARQPGTTVTLVHRGPDFGRSRPENRDALERAGSAITTHLNTDVRAVDSQEIMLSTQGKPFAVRAELVVCCLGAELPSRWLRSLGVEIRELRGERVA